jgi:hypothetical protein
VKQALDECAGLEGERLKACWASNGARAWRCAAASGAVPKSVWLTQTTQK